MTENGLVLDRTMLPDETPVSLCIAEGRIAVGKDDPDAHTRRLRAELFLLSAEKLQEALRAFVEETSFDWESLP